MTSRVSLRLIGACCLSVLAIDPLQAQEAGFNQSPSAQSAQDLKRLTIEELADLTVTTAAKRIERLSDVAAAISVIREEDIRRSGATSLAEALRLADGVHLAQVYGPGWAISARGFNISTANKLLVLIDGRTVYSPLFSGVFWDVQDVVLADIDRIEVIRGPGGTLWGANAVNGVVNIITRRAADTPGGLVTITAGTETRAVATARYGGTTAGGTAYRAYAKFRADDEHVFATGVPAGDGVQFGQSGFRIESNAARTSFWSVQGDVYYGTEGLYDRPDTRLSGGNLLTRWTRRWSATSQFQAQVYYDRTNRRVQRQYRAGRDTVDVDTQQQLQLGSRHRIVFGAGFRASRGDDLGDGPGFFFDPQVRTSTLGSFFAQDDIVVKPNRLSVIAGAKLEHNDFTGFELQPNLRLRLTPGPRQTVWGAVSRAVRMPTRFDTDLRVRLPASDRLLLTGTAAFVSENVLAYEAGYRVRPAERVSFDLAAFANNYDHLRSQEPPAAPGDAVVLGNGLNARTSGAEIAATATITPRWQAHASYSYLWERFSPAAGSRDVSGGASEANDPSHLFSVRSSLDLPRRFELDAVVRYTSRLPNPVVEPYTELTTRLGWRATDRWELSLIGQNLLHDRHEEFAAGTPRELYQRAVSVRSAWRF
ncbi:MAG: TonB-dependent receptor plug domain-containing protein [Acidobacteriota bacterium]